MKTKLFSLSLLAGGFLIACGSGGGDTATNNDADKDESANERTAQTEEVAAPARPSGETVALNKERSHVEWVATKEAGGGHRGVFHIIPEQSNVTVENGEVTSAKLVFDLRNLKITDEPSMPKDKVEQLVGHLQSEDFFNVEENPTATFEMVDYKDGKMRGNLTMLGKTRTVTLDCEHKVDGKTVIASGKTKVNRTNWGMNYNPEQAVIKNQVELRFNLASANAKAS